MPELPDPVDDGHCIGCGPLAETGLKMRFVVERDGSVSCAFTLPQRFQGWRDVAHGGVVALVLDEAMAYAAGARGHLGVTADLKMRFRKPVPIGEPLVVRGEVRWQRRNALGIAAELFDATGALLASGEGTFISRGTVPPGQRFGESVRVEDLEPVGDGG
jgi:uncharacterized protein (TIGR00369 family)